MDYKEKLEEAKRLYESANDEQKHIIENLFPELKESEDERIRKEIITHCRNTRCVTEESAERIAKWIAWLEKQGKQKPTLPKWKYKNDNTPLLRDSLILNKYGCVAKSPSGAFVNDVWVIDYDELAKLPKEELEKQGEQETLCDKCRQQQSKQEWSEEDERNLQNIDSVLFYDKTLPEDTCVKLRDFLKTLKDRVGCEANCTTTKEWSEEDEHRVKDTIYFLDTAKKHYASTVELDGCIDWFKSLKQRIGG